MKRSLSFILFVGLIAAGVSSCRTKQHTFAMIQVLDEHNQEVADASVTLFTEPPYEQGAVAVVNKTAETDSRGRVWFNFDDVFQLGQQGVVVLKIQANYSDKNGTGLIKVEQERTNKATVFIQP